MAFKKGDTVTQRGVWLPATVIEVGDQVIEVRWHNHAKINFPELSFVPVYDVLSWEEGLGREKRRVERCEVSSQ